MATKAEIAECDDERLRDEMEAYGKELVRLREEREINKRLSAQRALAFLRGDIPSFTEFLRRFGRRGINNGNEQ